MKYLLYATFALILTACGGGGSASSSTPPVGEPGAKPLVLAGTVSTFESPVSVAVDAENNVYVADNLKHAIYKVTAQGQVSVVAGKPGMPMSIDVQGAGAGFNGPEAVIAGMDGSLYVADTGNNAIRKISRTGLVTTLAGGATAGHVDGNGLHAKFDQPYALAIHPNGDLYVSDRGTYKLRKITQDGSVSTLDRMGNQPVAAFAGMAFDATGNFYATLTEGIVKISPTGEYSYSQRVANGSVVTGVAITSNGDIVAATLDAMHAAAVVKISAAGWTNQSPWQLVAGGTTAGFINAAGDKARFKYSKQIAADQSGNIVVADFLNAAVRRVRADGVVTTLSGTTDISGFADGNGNAAKLGYLWGITHDSNGNIYVTDTYNHAVRKITPSGTVSTPWTEGPDANPLLSQTHEPTGITFVDNTLLYVGASRNPYSDYNPFITRELGPVKLHFGMPGGGFFTENRLTHLAVSKAGDVIWYDVNQLKKWSHARSHVGWEGIAINGTDSNPEMPRPFDNPRGIVTDSKGNIFLADFGYSVITKVTPAGEASLFAGMYYQMGEDDGAGRNARFRHPYELAIDDQDNLYIAQHGPVRKISPAGMVTTPKLAWGTPSVHSLTVANGMIYGAVSGAVIQTPLPQ